MTATINRVMVVELALPALVPGVLIAAVSRRANPAPCLGLSLRHRRATRALDRRRHGGAGDRRRHWRRSARRSRRNQQASACLSPPSVFCWSAPALARRAPMCWRRSPPASRPGRRAAAATTVWVMMIFGFALTAPLAGHFLDPYSPSAPYRRLERDFGDRPSWSPASLFSASKPRRPRGRNRRTKRERASGQAFQQDWSEPAARRFTIFIFVSMLAYSAQELLVEPFAGLVFGLPPGVTTKLAGLQHGGALAGMILVAICASAIGGARLGDLKFWTVSGCVASA